MSVAMNKYMQNYDLLEPIKKATCVVVMAKRLFQLM